jgi:hypothetical protein
MTDEGVLGWIFTPFGGTMDEEDMAGCIVETGGEGVQPSIVTYNDRGKGVKISGRSRRLADSNLQSSA